MDTEPPGNTPPPAAPRPVPRPAPVEGARPTHEPTPGARADKAVPIPQLVTDLRDLVVDYVKQETLVPLKSLGRWVGFGLGGSLLLGFGVVFLALAGLRALQTETGETFTGNWSWAPYVIVVIALAIGGALVWVARSARANKEIT